MRKQAAMTGVLLALAFSGLTGCHTRETPALSARKAAFISELNGGWTTESCPPCRAPYPVHLNLSVTAAGITGTYRGNQDDLHPSGKIEGNWAALELYRSDNLAAKAVVQIEGEYLVWNLIEGDLSDFPLMLKFRR